MGIVILSDKITYTKVSSRFIKDINVKVRNYIIFRQKYRIISLGIRVKEYFLSKTQKMWTMILTIFAH